VPIAAISDQLNFQCLRRGDGSKGSCMLHEGCFAVLQIAGIGSGGQQKARAWQALTQVLVSSLNQPLLPASG
jgi:hypothetical protein